MRIEQYGLAQLVGDLERAGPEVTKKVARTTGTAMNNIKKDVQKRWRGLPHLPHLPRSITYDVTTRGYVVTGEVGAEHEREQGKLAWIPEYGTPTSAPHPGFAPAAAKELPSWIGWVERVAGEVLDD